MHSVPRFADEDQRAVGRQRLRKLSRTSIADLGVVEIELRRAETSRHSVGQWVSYPFAMRTSPRPVMHSVPRLADEGQRAVGRQRFRKLRSASVANTVVEESELRRPETSNGRCITRQCVLASHVHAMQT